MNRILPPPIYVNTPVKLAATVALLQRERLLALDTESNSLHAYQERVCLIQVSSRKEDYIIDPLALDDLSPLGALLEDDRIEKVFHAAEYDMLCLKRDYGFKVRNLFDTMIAARVCGQKETGLGSLILNFFGVKMDKSHQRDDWGKRPLPEASLLYAQMDTHYLPDLRDKLGTLIEASGRSDEAHEWFRETCDLPAGRPRQHDALSFWRLALPNQLSLQQCAILSVVYDAREQIAKDRNLPPFKVVSDPALVNLAKVAPTHMRDIRRVMGITNGQADRYGEVLIKAIKTGLKTPLPNPPPPDPPADPMVVERYTALREWRKQKAAERNVEADVIVSKDALWTLAQLAPDTLDTLGDVRGFGTWRRYTYGDEIMQVLARFHKKGL